MALNIADLTFGLGANTAGLQKSLKKVVEFGRVANEAAKSQEKGAKAATAQYARQEAAIRANLLQVLNLSAAIRRAGGDPALIGQTTIAFRSMVNETTRGTQSTLEFNRVQDQFKARLGKTQRALQSFKADKAQKSMGRFNEVVRDLESASVLAVGPLSGLGARIRALGAITSRSTLLIAGMLGAVAGLTVGIFKLASAAIASGRDMERLEGQLKVSTGTAVLAAAEFNSLLVVSERLGINVGSVSEEFGKLSAAAAGTEIAGEGVQRIFLGVSSAGAALRLSTSDVAGAFRALQQVLSKGKVQAEEIRGQFGERIPGGFRLAARAMGKTTAEFSKMLETGKVLSEDFLPKLAEELIRTFGQDALDAADTFTGSLNNLANATFEFNREFDKTISATDTAKSVIQSLTGLVKLLTENINVLLASVAALGPTMTVIFAPQILAGLGFLAEAFSLLILRVRILAITLLALPFAGLLSVIAKVVAVTGTAIGSYLLFKSALDDTTQSLEDFMKASEDLLRLQGKLTKAQELQTELQIEASRTRIQAIMAEVEAQRILIESQSLGVGIGVGDTATSGQRAELEILAEKMESLLAKVFRLDGLLRQLDDDADETGDALSDAFKDAAEEVDELMLALGRLDAQRQALLRGGEKSLAIVDDLFEAQDILAELTLDDTAALAEKLGVAFEDVESALASLITQLRLGEEANDALGDAIGDFKEDMQEVDDIFKEMAEHIEALKGGPEALEKFNKAVKDKKALEDFVELLQQFVDAGLLSQQVFAQLVAGFKELQGELEEAQDDFDKLVELTEAVEDAIKSSFDRIGKAITEAFVTGEASALSFQSIVEGVLSEILQKAIELAIIDPFVKFATGAISGLLGGLLGGAAAPSAGDFNVGGTTTVPFAHGGSFTVPGSGGTDSQIIPFSLTPGERVDVLTKSQQALEGRQGGSTVQVFDNRRSGAPVDIIEEIGPGGEAILQVMIEDVVERALTQEDTFGSSVGQSLGTFGRALGRQGSRNR